MKNTVLKIALSVGLGFMVGCDSTPSELANISTETTAVIYGEDSRQEISPALAELAQSVAVIFPNNRLRQFNSEYFLLNSKSLRDSEKLCPGERFEYQPILGTCTGALVGPDLVLTAGHCVSAPEVCKTYAVSFGWDLKKAQTGILAKKEIFHCKRILEIQDNPYQGLDYALIQLDRKVNAPILKIHKGGITEKLLSLSHPHGLPLKADYATAYEPYKHSTNMFKVQVDTSHSSSGSPLFNNRKEIVGVLSMGNMDFADASYRVQGETCRRIEVCKGYECTGQIFDGLHHLKYQN